MEKQAIIRRAGPIIDIGTIDGTALPKQDLAILQDPLHYTHLQYNHSGFNEFTQRSEKVTSEHRKLYEFDMVGRLVLMKGYRSYAETTLQSMGYKVAYLDRNPPPKRPKRYDMDWDNVFSKFEFRSLQDQCLAQIAMHDCGIIDAVTAFGKAYIIWMVAALYPQAKIDIVTKRKDVAQNLFNLGHRFVPSVGMRGGGKKRIGRVTVYTADSMHHSDFDADIVMFDEVHELMTDRYIELVSRYGDTRTFGFTASKETRFDNAHHRMEGHIGPTIFYLDYPTAEAHGLVVPIIVQWLDFNLPVNPCGGVSNPVARKRWGIWRNEARNHKIAQFAQSIVDSGMQTLLLVETVEHALYLRQFLPNFELCYSEQALSDQGKRAGYIRDGMLGEYEDMTSTRRQELREAFEQQKIMAAIATGVWSTGVSFDGLQCLGRIDGGSSETNSVQMPGRVGRLHPESGKDCGIMFDMNDMFDAGFRTNTTSRRRMYESRKWTQITNAGHVMSTNGKRRRR